MRAENVVLPQNGYFGISAATGGLADDHDVLKFSVTSLRTLEEAKNLVVDPEVQKNQDEFDEYEKKLKTQKDQWRKDNPEEVRKKSSDFLERFVSVTYSKYYSIARAIAVLEW